MMLKNFGLRAVAVAVVLALVGLLVAMPGARSASAAPTTSAPTNAPARGGSLSLSGLPADFTTSNGTGTIQSLTIQGFQVIDGVLQAFGSATGTFTPTGGTAAPFTTHFTAPLDPSGTCPILSLTLGPINLDLLGLVVTTNQINLNITAVSGPGNLLGNLLCAVTHLLDNNPTSGGIGNLLNQIAGLLTQLLGTL